MNFLERLRTSAEDNKSIVCMGLDPVIESMPEKHSRDSINGVPGYFREIFQEMINQRIFPGAFKPNQGFYLRHDNPMGIKEDFSGSIALAKVLGMLEDLFPLTPVILDYKRGDIAKSSANYAAEGFESWRADAVTIAPYMGTDSVMPFIGYCNEVQEKGVYILNRTSNPGAQDFQGSRVIPGDIEIENIIEERLREFFRRSRAVPDEKLYSEWIIASDESNFVRQGMRESFRETINDSSMPFYMAVAEKIIKWAEDKPGVGAVVGATSLDELELLVQMYSGKDIPLLIPGVGGQGGKADEVINVLRDAGYDLSLARINSSSGLTHPWKNAPAPDDYAKVCVEELNKLNEAIGYK